MDSGLKTPDFFRQLVEQSSDYFQGISLDGTLTYASPSFQRLLSCPLQSIVGLPCYSYIAEPDVIRFQHAFTQLVQERISLYLEYRLLLPGGSMRWVEAKANLIYVEDKPQHIALIARDIDKHKQLEERLTYMAYYDSLTGLPNRRLFQDRYTQAILSAKRYQHKTAVIYLDLDDFKLVNDRYGHAVGDELLRVVASRLAHCVRDPDTVCRLGGDEFVILLQQCEHKDDIQKVAMRIIESINHPYIIHAMEISISCSLGAAAFPDNTSDGDLLLQCADAAMYQAKQHGKNYFQSLG